jgi:hypothetical protein
MKKAIGFVLPVFFLSIVISFFTTAPAAGQSTGFFLLLNTNQSISLCVGQTINITGEYFSDPLIRGKARAGTLIAVAKLGTISPFKTFVSGIRGPYTLVYKAGKPGTDQVTLTLYDDKIRSSVLATKNIQIKVEETCQYLLTVKGMLASVHTAGEFEMQQEFQLLLKETITQTGANPPRFKFESEIFQMTHTIPVFQAPDCTNLISTLGTATGTRAAAAELTPDGKSMHVGLYDISLKTKHEAAIGCNFEEGYHEFRKGGSFDFGYVGGLDDFWVEGTLPLVGGVIQIKKLEPFEVYKKRLSQSGQASYHVIMKLEKLSSK